MIVSQGDYLLFNASKAAWFAAPDGVNTVTTIDDPLLARALEPLAYREDEGGHTSIVKSIAVAKYYANAQAATEVCRALPQGHRQLMTVAESDRYIKAWSTGVVNTAINTGRGIKEVVDRDGLVTHQFLTGV